MGVFLVERAVACIRGVAVGDAMGKMTEGYWPEEVLSAYGGYVQDFRKPFQPKSRSTWGYAEVTDDTTFTLLIAESIVEKENVDRKDIIQRILNHRTKIKGWPGWDDFYAAAHQGDDGIANFAKWRDGNGAPTRVSPIGIIHSPKKIEEIIRDVDAACSMTHQARSALSGACAIAATISAAIEGWKKEEVFEFAIEMARLGESLGNDDARPPADRILMGINFVNSYKGSCLARDLRRILNPGFQAYEGVPYALSLTYGLLNAKEAILASINQGGDADSIASMAGSVAAALDPNTLPEKWIQEVEKTNSVNLAPVALKLTDLRK